MIEHAKGIIASVATVSSAITVWASAIEVFLRIGVSIVGIIAGIYAARYWHKRTKILSQQQEKESGL